jgi:hypothetical protein
LTQPYRIRCNDISAEDAKGQVRTAQQRISGAQNLAVVHLPYRHDVPPDAQDTGDKVAAFPKSCLNPMMIPFMHFFIKHMSYLTVTYVQPSMLPWNMVQHKQQLQVEEVEEARSAIEEEVEEEVLTS